MGHFIFWNPTWLILYDPDYPWDSHQNSFNFGFRMESFGKVTLWLISPISSMKLGKFSFKRHVLLDQIHFHRALRTMFPCKWLVQTLLEVLSGSPFVREDDPKFSVYTSENPSTLRFPVRPLSHFTPWCYVNPEFSHPARTQEVQIGKV